MTEGRPIENNPTEPLSIVFWKCAAGMVNDVASGTFGEKASISPMVGTLGGSVCKTLFPLTINAILSVTSRTATIFSAMVTPSPKLLTHSFISSAKVCRASSVLSPVKEKDFFIGTKFHWTPSGSWSLILAMISSNNFHHTLCNAFVSFVANVPSPFPAASLTTTPPPLISNPKVSRSRRVNPWRNIFINNSKFVPLGLVVKK